MKPIKDAADIIAKILGEQRVQHDQEARVATWCIAVPVTQGNILLLNNLTRELLLIDQAESGFLCLRDLSTSNLKNMQDSALFSFLYRHWFLVPKEHDDGHLVDEVREVAACMERPRGITGYTILTTTDCNARCFYCYEHSLERVHMTRQTAFDTAAYIKKTAGEKIQLHWFGGEPLFHPAAIDIITEELTKAGIDFHSVMTSNRYLATENIVKKAVEAWKLQKIQITLDGTEEIYNQRKAFVHSEGSAFVRVIDNIGRLLEAGIEVQVRLNLDRENADDLYRLSDFLADRFSSCEKLQVYAHEIFEDKAGNYSCRDSYEDIREELVRLNRYLTEKGLTPRRRIGNTIRTTHCMADNDASIVITPTGALHKCEHIDPTQACGTIYTGAQNQKILEYWKKRPKPAPGCRACPLYADCVRIAACPDFIKCSEPVYQDKIAEVQDAMLYTYETSLLTFPR